MIRFDEFIWRVSPAIDNGRELVHKERDVNFNIDAPFDEKAVGAMIASLIGQDAKCQYSDKLTVTHLTHANGWIWAFASGDETFGEYYSVLLIPIQ